MLVETVLGDKIKCNNTLPVDHQIHRCRRHKKYEAELLLKMAEGSAFLDIGAHYGDTVLTMALHAKVNNRSDIRFFAFEPNQDKCDYIRMIGGMNELNIVVFQNGVGDESCKITEDQQVPNWTGGCSYKKNEHGTIEVLKLDDCQLGNVGFMHIDVEGWEANVLRGSCALLKKNRPFLIIECWPDEYSLRRGFSSTPEEDIAREMERHEFRRMPDLIDEEKNLVFFPKN